MATSGASHAWVHSFRHEDLSTHPLLLLALAATALADLPFKKKPQEFTTHVPSEVAHTLRRRHAGAAQRPGPGTRHFRAQSFQARAKSNSPCVDFHHMEERPVTLRAGAENVVLLADSSECDSTYLVVFDKAPKSEWRHVQTVRLPSRGAASRGDLRRADSARRVRDRGAPRNHPRQRQRAAGKLCRPEDAARPGRSRARYYGAQRNHAGEPVTQPRPTTCSRLRLRPSLC